jgi:hypothetical protein
LRWINAGFRLLIDGRRCPRRKAEDAMPQMPSPDGQPFKSLMRRLDRLCGEMNAFLIVLAIGLALLDLACFTLSRVFAEMQTVAVGRVIAGEVDAGAILPQSMAADPAGGR